MKNITRSVSVIAIGLATVSLACQVPVFRYALERWPADDYEIVILHDGPLSETQQTAVERLSASDQGAAGSANYHVMIKKATEIQDKRLQELWAKRGVVDQPLLAIFYPPTAQEVPDRLVHVGPLTTDSTNDVPDSPIRQTIAKRLISGESAVWIFVPCGDPKQDEVALATLTNEVEKNEQLLELPEQEEIQEVKELLEQVEIELRLDFSIVTLNRDDPKEQFLLKTLLASESDLQELKQPMAFPVLGRGRVLYALVGKGISPETIGMASRFIIGPCSCQVKNLNPGFDLLMAYDWDGRIGEAKLSDPLPEENAKPVLLTIPRGK